MTTTAKITPQSAHYVLIADTSANSLSVVLAKWTKPFLILVDSYTEDSPQRANQKLIPTINSLCRKHTVEPTAISYFAITTGPGSFTGTRIGVITFKALAYIAQQLNPSAKLLPLSSHLALAYSARAMGATGPYTSAINALRNQTFNAQFELNNERIKSLSPLDSPAVDNDKAILDNVDHKITVQGLCDYVQTVLTRIATETKSSERSPFADPFTLLPTYTRLSDAEEKEICEGKAYDGGKLPVKIAAAAPLTVLNADKSHHTRSSMQYLALNQPTRADKTNSYILGIETSCDETAVCIMADNGLVLSSVISSSVPWHARFGGVVPEIASRKHLEFILPTLDTALKQAKSVQGDFDLNQIGAVAVASQPGLIGALVLGVAAAKSIAWLLNVPLISVNHLIAHLYACRFDTSVLPAQADSSINNRSDICASVIPAQAGIHSDFVGSIISGGHTLLVYSNDWIDLEVLGSTIDDAVGEAFDKIAKALGLGYPGGPAISKLAELGDKTAIDFPRSLLHSHQYDFSLSGLKTAVSCYIAKLSSVELKQQTPDICASFQAAVIEVQGKKALAACQAKQVNSFISGGGVIVNSELQAEYKKLLEAHGITCYFPPAELTGDNAAMIAAVGLEKYRAGEFASLDLDASGQAVRKDNSGESQQQIHR